MKMSFQIPTAYMGTFMPLEDFHFALAHLVLYDKNYLQTFKYNRSKFTLMDNGVHERGEPLHREQLISAAHVISADAVIPPDKFFDYIYTVNQALHMASAVGGTEKLWPVVQGKTMEELNQCYEDYLINGFTTVCLPYRLKQLRMEFIEYLDGTMHHHFLSLNHLDEMQWMVKAPHASIDTGKVFRYAQNDCSWAGAEGKNLPKLNMNGDLNVQQAMYNLHKMRKAASDAEREVQ